MPISIAKSKIRSQALTLIDSLQLSQNEKRALRAYAANAPDNALATISELLLKRNGAQKILQLFKLKKEYLRTGSEYAMEQVKNAEKDIIEN